MLRLGPIAGALASLPAVLPAQVDAGLQERIDAALDRGMDALLARQELDGSWRAHLDAYPGGTTALAAHALLHAGLPRDHPGLRRAFAFLRHHPPERTYTAACQLLAFCALADASEAERISALRDLLLAWERDGGFAYPDGDVDMSNTQCAALALRAAVRAGHAVPPDLWERLAARVAGMQAEPEETAGPAGFGYREGGEVSASMTAAGVGVLAICAEQGVLGPRVERALSLGLAWLGRHFAVEENFPRGREYLHYYLYGLERVGDVLGIDRIGEHDWYTAGAGFLVTTQGADGGWRGQPQTAFALLFLSRATAPRSGAPASTRQRVLASDPDADLVLRATGYFPLTLWIASFGGGAPELEWDGERGLGPRVIRVEYRRRSAGAEDELLAAVDGDPLRPARDERFAVRHAFERAGVHTVYAAVHVLQPGFTPADPLGQYVLHSAPIQVRVPQPWHAELVGYADDIALDLLRGVHVEVEASSERDEWHAARRAVDGLSASGWRAADADARPWIRLELDPPSRADTLLLSHPLEPPSTADGAGRIRRLALHVNRSRRPVEIELSGDPWRKTVTSFGRATRIATLELRVLETSKAGDVGGVEAPGAAGVGLAEIELQLRGGRR